MSAERFKIGDTVCTVYAGPTQVTRPCRACAGTRVVTLILGSGEHVQLDCGACQLGYDFPRGVETDYAFEARATPYQVTGVEVVESEKGEEVRYRSGGENAYSILYHEKCFATMDEALANGATLVAEHEAEAERRIASKEKDQAKSYAWNAAYHLREAKRHRAEAERHERKAVALKAKAKDDTQPAPASPTTE